MRYAAVADEVGGARTGFDPEGGYAQVKTSYYMKCYTPMTPMGYFARFGDLPMMRWLYVNGADTRDLNVHIRFPMFAAAFSRYVRKIEAVKWLYTHGAARDLMRKTTSGHMPIQFVVSDGGADADDPLMWFVMNGALCKDDGSRSGDLDISKMKAGLTRSWSNFSSRYVFSEARRHLLKSAKEMWQPRLSFQTFMMGTLSRKHAYNTRRNSTPLAVFSGKSGILELICDFVGIVRGRDACIVRNLVELLPGVHEEIEEEEEQGLPENPIFYSTRA